MSEFPTQRLDEFIADGSVLLGRGDVISKDDIEAHPGPYPIYSSSAHNNGKFGEYGKFMFDEELITWSVDGGGYFFYRPKHKYSVTNVCGYMRLRGEKLHPKFVYYSLANQHRYLTFDYTTKAHPSVIKKQYWLPTIAIEQQQKIAAVLTCIDTNIEKTEALIAKYQQIKAGLMHDLFTRGVTADGKLRPPREQALELYRETPIGWIPREWNPYLLGNKLLVIDPNPSHRYPEEVSEGIPICSTESFFGEDDFEYSKSKMVPNQVYLEQYNRCQFHHNDVVFARKGKIGLARRYGQEKKVFSHTVVLLKPNSSEIHADWLVWLARSDWMLKRIEGTMNTNLGVPTLGVGFIQAVEAPFPSKDEQKLVSTKLDAAAIILANETASLEKLKKQKLGLMSDLLTGKVRVKLDAKSPEMAGG